ncbi:MAG: rRNA pseudouridine synthase [Paludibacteraceae bacterium]|nr:rRNA pseudouridine synthase [Paludibacteraceae bacterium]MBQ2607742.1 rRNA pseudouridine synthase [Paludibacteraceae bacterium]
MFETSNYRRNPQGQSGRETGHSRPRFVRNAGEGDEQRRPRFQAGERSQNGERPQFGRRPRFQTGERQQTGERPHYGAERVMRPRRNAPTAAFGENKRQKFHERIEDPTKPIRLNKYLANAGICSRREADDFIQAGVITVNGEVVSSLGTKVLPTDHVMFHNQPVRRERKIYILLNKPKNTVTTTDDPQERRTVIDIVRNACAERIYPVGRLDRNTTGVLLLTNDGDLAAKLTHPKFGKKKIYAATLDHELTEVDEAILRNGVTLDGERIVPDALEFPKEDRRHIGLEIHSGQNRVVRRMFEKVGYKVVTLDRVSFAGLTKKNVARGKYRFLTPKEVAMLQMGAFE